MLKHTFKNSLPKLPLIKQHSVMQNERVSCVRLDIISLKGEGIRFQKSNEIEEESKHANNKGIDVSQVGLPVGFGTRHIMLPHVIHSQIVILMLDDILILHQTCCPYLEPVALNKMHKS